MGGLEAFRWNEWNIGHIGKHGLIPFEAEQIVRGASPPYPRKIGEGRFLVRGQLPAGDYVQVIFVFDEDRTVFVIHARPLTDNEKRQYRRGRK